MMILFSWSWEKGFAGNNESTLLEEQCRLDISNRCYTIRSYGHSVVSTFTDWLSYFTYPLTMRVLGPNMLEGLFWFCQTSHHNWMIIKAVLGILETCIGLTVARMEISP